MLVFRSVRMTTMMTSRRVVLLRSYGEMIFLLLGISRYRYAFFSLSLRQDSYNFLQIPSLCLPIAQMDVRVHLQRP